MCFIIEKTLEMKSKFTILTILFNLTVFVTFSQIYSKVNAPWLNNPFDITGDFKYKLIDYRLFGKVKIVVSNNNRDTLKFNKLGYLTESVNYDSKGKLKNKTTIEYKSDEILQNESKFYDKFNFITIHKLDLKNRIKESFRIDKPQEKFIFIYDNKNNLTSLKNTKYNSHEKYRYNDENQIIKYEYFNSEGKIDISKTIQYNDYKSNKTLKIISVFEGQESSYSIKYDQFGNLNKNKYEYDNKGNWISKVNDYSDNKRVIIYY